MIGNPFSVILIFCQCRDSMANHSDIWRKNFPRTLSTTHLTRQIVEVFSESRQKPGLNVLSDQSIW